MGLSVFPIDEIFQSYYRLYNLIKLDKTQVFNYAPQFHY